MSGVKAASARVIEGGVELGFAILAGPEGYLVAGFCRKASKGGEFQFGFRLPMKRKQSTR